jgi:hypothetical protein
MERFRGPLRLAQLRHRRIRWFRFGDRSCGVAEHEPAGPSLFPLLPSLLHDPSAVVCNGTIRLRIFLNEPARKAPIATRKLACYSVAAPVEHVIQMQAKYKAGFRQAAVTNLLCECSTGLLCRPGHLGRTAVAQGQHCVHYICFTAKNEIDRDEVEIRTGRALANRHQRCTRKHA